MTAQEWYALEKLPIELAKLNMDQLEALRRFAYRAFNAGKRSAK